MRFKKARDLCYASYQEYYCYTTKIKSQASDDLIYSILPSKTTNPKTCMVILIKETMA